MVGRNGQKLATLLTAVWAESQGESARMALNGYCRYIGFASINCRKLKSTSRRFLTSTLFPQATSTTPTYFLLKSEPDEFSIQDLQKQQEEEWNGVRNFQARNKMRLMRKGDLAFFYHSSCKVPAIVGTMRVVRETAPDVTALDPDHKGYDPKSTPENCRWDSVRVRIESIFENPVTLQQLKEASKSDETIADTSLLRISRLSVHEVSSDQWEKIMAMANAKPSDSSPKKSKLVSKASKSTQGKTYFVFKSDPSVLSIQELAKRPGMKGEWRYGGNDESELAMLQTIKGGEEGFLYHSKCNSPGIVGRVQVEKQTAGAKGSISIRAKEVYEKVLRLKDMQVTAKLQDCSRQLRGRAAVYRLDAKEFEGIEKLVADNEK